MSTAVRHSKHPSAANENPQKNAQVPKTETQSLSQVETFRQDVEHQSLAVYKSLQGDCEKIEASVFQSEEAVIVKSRLHFLANMHEAEYAQLKDTLEKELKTHKDLLDHTLKARASRKLAKKQHRIALRATKRRDRLIQQQEFNANVAARNRESFVAKRNAFDMLVGHLTELHESQRKKNIASQDRKLEFAKNLNDFENKHLKQEVRNNLAKKFQVRQSFQIAFNKRVNDQLRELQLLELRQAKEKFEVEMAGFEELGSMKMKHNARLSELKARHADEIHNEKEFILTNHEAAKLQTLERENEKAIKKHVHQNRIVLRQLRLKHDQIFAEMSGHYKNAGSKGNSRGGSVASTSQAPSAHISRSGSHDSLNSGSSKLSGLKSDGVASSGGLGVQSTVHMMDNAMNDENDETENSFKTSKRTSANLERLLKRHEEETLSLQTLIQQDLSDFDIANAARLAELEEKHDAEIKKLLSEQSHELEVLKTTQEKEIIMEEAMHDTEMKALLERKILNSILDTVDDGIINIDTKGIIRRFNKAAEKIWGYSADEVIGKNVTILMPAAFAVNHESYLNAYLTTGIKKVIGIPNGRRIEGKRKDGSVFPLQLSASELKTEDNHLFTGIARDITEECKLEEESKRKEQEKRKEFQHLITELDTCKAKGDNLISAMLPSSISDLILNDGIVEPQKYESVSILYMDIAGFTSICAKIDPADSMRLLDELYAVLDSVIEQYDAIKIEAVCDSYMIASGVPRKNGRRHASEITTLALHIISALSKFEFKGHPDVKIQARIGIHSGSVLAGVVGSKKLPRYCLFGETVNTASIIESSSKPLKIQVSEATQKLLIEAGGFDINYKGEMDVKGRGKMMTYYVHGKEGFAHDLPDAIKKLDWQ